MQCIVGMLNNPDSHDCHGFTDFIFLQAMQPRVCQVSIPCTIIMKESVSVTRSSPWLANADHVTWEQIVGNNNILTIVH